MEKILLLTPLVLGDDYQAIFCNEADELMEEMRELLKAEGFDMDGVCDVCTVTTFIAKRNAKVGKKMHDILDMILAN